MELRILPPGRVRVSFKAPGADIPFASAIASIMILGRQAPSCKFKPEKTPALRHRP
ncbi:hypothetical protein L905_27625 [Agrobacterium sp. TS43]|nr:hypothetical protein L902_25265 [Agrobacterium radiobacter DSM 30147]KVK40346.1 hypothetical protein L903_15070 [Agrobacterium sp. JL28]KVK40427.1 hypothetical protein L904_15090 [Agrobacterium sp. LY4]KVK54363.1 hypothetical protein L906_15035 [Agrobacterium sp. TS45]KVK56909.1 hypothetical protein L907_15000 [Agrobacterium sp. C13]KVK70281.1 hypothetical protein L905_27625 [Agrobacterium sp. TS43]